MESLLLAAILLFACPHFHLEDGSSMFIQNVIIFCHVTQHHIPELVLNSKIYSTEMDMIMQKSLSGNAYELYCGGACFESR
jgi:hypothetical protein